MKAHPLELRQRIVAAVDQQEHTIAEVAVLFNVSERHIYKLLEQRRATGDLAPLPHGGGALAKLDEAKLRQLADLVAAAPDASLDELRGLLRRRCRTHVSLNTVWRGLQQIDFTRKKSPAAPAKRAPPHGRRSAKNKRLCP